MFDDDDDDKFTNCYTVL